MHLLYIMVDVETNGPAPGLFSMISLGAVVVEPLCSTCQDSQRVWDNGDMTDCSCKNNPPQKKRRSFYGRFRPLEGAGCVPEALAVSGHTQAECADFPDPKEEMRRFCAWLEELQGEGYRLMFISDNNGFDWQFVNYYFWLFLGHNPFGHSSTNLGSLFKGLQKDFRQNFKHLRRTKHTHHPVDDSTGNVEAFLQMGHMGVKGILPSR